MITVALPVWKSKDIAWLCMESLCRMHQPKSEWELIVFEEEHDEKLGAQFFESYYERMRDIGCRIIKMKTSIIKYPLSQKWIIMANMADKDSNVFCLCACDNYYSPYMLIDAEKYIKEADWCIFPRGYFYDFRLNKVLKYVNYSNIGLQMFAKTDKVRNFPMDSLNKIVDTWVANHISPNGNNMMMINSDHWKHILCTNGMNTISIERNDFFEDPQPPYFETEAKLSDIVPEDIAIKLKELCLKLQL
jgi:hypothetical protein